MGIKLIDAIRKTHKEFEINPSTTNLLGTDEILKKDFEPNSFIANEIKKLFNGR